MGWCHFSASQDHWERSTHALYGIHLGWKRSLTIWEDFKMLHNGSRQWQPRNAMRDKTGVDRAPPARTTVPPLMGLWSLFFLFFQRSRIGLTSIPFTYTKEKTEPI